MDKIDPPTGPGDAAVSDFIKKHYTTGPPGAAPGINFHVFKTSCRGFKKLRYADIKAWFRARPQAYTVLGQLVLPHGIAAELPTTMEAAATAAPLSTIPPAVLTVLATSAQASLHCRICSIRCTSEDSMRDHVRGARHRNALERADAHTLEQAVLLSTADPTVSSCSHCELCGKWFTHANTFRVHVASSAHKARVFWLLLRRSGTLASDAPGTAAPTGTGTGTGSSIVPRVTVSSLPRPLPPVAPGATARHALTLTNHGPGSVKLRSAVLLTPVPDDSLRLEDLHGVAAQPAGSMVWVGEGSSYTVTLVVAPTALGLLRNLVVLDMAPTGPVARPVAASCCPPDMEPPPPPGVDAAQQQPLLPRGLLPVNDDIVPGIPPPGYQDGAPLPRPMQHLPVPAQLRWLVQRAEWGELRKMVPPLGEVGSLLQYADRLQKLLWLEELQHEIDIRVYDMKEVTLAKAGRTSMLELEVPGLAENRPSVLKGDRLLVMPSDRTSRRREYEGYVHAVERETVKLRFADSFMSGVWIGGRRFDVRFTVNRSAFNLMQNTLVRARDPRQLSPHLVLPGSTSAPLAPCSPAGLPLREPQGGDNLGPGGGARLVWQNATLNEEQRLAVREVLRGAHAPLPYLIFGPPGTGKTSTLVEAAKQLLLTRPSSASSPTRLLLVAPSNSAADLLIQSMAATSGAAAPRAMSHRLGPGGCLMMRLCAYSRPLEDLPLDLREQAEEHGLRPRGGLSLAAVAAGKLRTLGGLLAGGGNGGAGGRHVCAVNWDCEARSFLMPPLEMLKDPRLRVVVATCATAARLVHAGLPPGHFTHILVDEAGNAEEPLLLCALAGLAAEGAGRVVMAGDPRQLGPIILSLFAKKYGGLDLSLMERLLGQSGGPYDRKASGQQQGFQAATDSSPSSHSYNSTYITKLLHNYRSHPDILRVPNTAFYHGELVAAATPELTNSMLTWEELPNSRSPLLMHHVVGKDEQEANSPSWQNLLEARLVVDYVQKLLSKRGGAGSARMKSGLYRRTRSRFSASGCCLRSSGTTSRLAVWRSSRVRSGASSSYPQCAQVTSTWTSTAATGWASWPAPSASTWRSLGPRRCWCWWATRRSWLRTSIGAPCCATCGPRAPSWGRRCRSR